MTRKLFAVISLAAVIALAGCETYDMNTLSKKGHLSPTFGVSAVRGKISISDIKKIPNDTVRFDSDGFIRIVYKQDSVVSFTLDDYYDLNDMVSFNESYDIGEIKLGPFSGSAFPLTTTGELPFPQFTNFENATLGEGVLDITVRNNTAAVINTITITIYNASPHQALGSPAVISAINPGQAGTASINLADMTIIKNNTSVGFVINAGPGLVLNGSNFEIRMAGRDMSVKSGRIIVPPQTIPSLDDHDTIDFDPGEDVQIKFIKITSGNIHYSINNGSPLKSTMTLTLPTTVRNTVPITESLVVNPSSPLNGNISVNNSTIDLGTVSTQQYNKLPIDYQIEISSQNNLINFNSTDKITLDLNLQDPEFDYVRGYFGKQTETIDEDTLDLEIKDIVNKIEGDFRLANPSITLKYRNSFALPIRADLQVTGYKGSETVPLGLAPVNFKFPKAPAETDKDTLFTISKKNSNIADLVSMPPEKIRFSGSVEMNPDGNTSNWGNYIFGNSRFIGDLEVEVPLELRMNNLHFADTVENFMKPKEDDNSPFNPEDFEYLRIDLTAENKFPLAIEVGMSLYSSSLQDTLCSVTAPELLKAAPVDDNGKVTEPVTSKTSLYIRRNFWNSVSDADSVIIDFTLNTTDGDKRDIKIYSDYYIDFKASLVLKPDFKFNEK